MSDNLPTDTTPFTIPLKGNFGTGDSERCIEIPWALYLYAGEATVLDVGYAHAERRYISELLSLRIPHLHGIDLVEKNIEGIIPHTMDIRKTRFKDNFFDMVLCISTLEHIGRDISRYTHDTREIQGDGDFEALREIVRITKNNGKIVLTVPYGKEADYGWQINYNEKRFQKLLTTLPLQIVFEEYFIYTEGWEKCDKKRLEDVEYQDNNAQAAAGLACVLLKKIRNNGTATGDNRPEPVSGHEGTSSIKSNNENVDNSGAMVNNQEISNKFPEEGTISPEPESSATPVDLSGKATEDEFLQRYLEFLNRTWDIQNDTYLITSHQPVLGNVLVQGRQLINGEVKRYIDPVIFQQTEFNANTVRILNWLVKRIEDLELQVTEECT
jgi:SAM-dependent methyltransferase